MQSEREFGRIVVDPDGPAPEALPLWDRVFVGRECPGVDDSRRIVLADDVAVSRNHLEIRVDPETAAAVLVDTSSNGTRLNGVRVERSLEVPLRTGDRIQVGSHVLEYLGSGKRLLPPDRFRPRPTPTLSVTAPTLAAIVVGDVVDFSSVSERADQRLLARDIGILFDTCRDVVGRHRGTLMNYMGDAFFASWETDAHQSAADNALAFAIEGSRCAAECAKGLDLRYGDGSPLRMGWAVALGRVVIRLMPGSLVTALGDVVNVGFRIAGLAGRDGRAEILATRAVREVAKGSYAFGDLQTVFVKGRVGAETVYGLTTATAR